MKKIVIAAALAAASIAASAQVTVYGMVREYVDNTKVGGVSTTQMVDDTSRIGIKASETLGNGLTARIVVETGFAANDPATNADTKLGNRQSTVGLASINGSVDFGRKTNTFFEAIDANDVFTTDYGSIAGDIHSVRTVRSGNAVFVNYTYGPVTVAYDRTASGLGGEATSYSATGKLGPVAANIARFEQGVDKSTVLGVRGSYAGTNLFASTSFDTSIFGDVRGTMVGASRQLTVMPIVLKASYGVKTGDVRAFALGADYALSKRTGVSVAYRNVNDFVDTRQLGLGLTHRF